MTASRLRDNWIPAVAGSGRPLRANAARAFNNGATNTGGRMAEPRHIPRNAVLVEQYEDLNSFTQAFAAGHLRFLVVVGPAGTGKSRAMRNAVADRAAWVDGNATAFGVYCAAFMHQDQPIVLDDVDALYRDANGIRLLKQLCQSEPSRLLSWYSDPQYMERRGVPLEFTTSSPVAIIANRWSTVNADVAALEDRGHMIAFDPSPIEIHRQAARWFRDQEIFEFVSGYSEHLPASEARLAAASKNSTFCEAGLPSVLCNRAARHRPRKQRSGEAASFRTTQISAHSKPMLRNAPSRNMTGYSQIRRDPTAN